MAVSPFNFLSKDFCSRYLLVLIDSHAVADLKSRVEVQDLVITMQTTTRYAISPA